MDFGTPPFPPPFAVTPDGFYARGQSGEPSWTARGMEDGGGCVLPPGSWRRVECWGAELQSPRHPHPTSAIAVCLMCFFMGIPQESDRQDGSYRAHMHVHTQVCKAQFQDQLDEQGETGESHWSLSLGYLQ